MDYLCVEFNRRFGFAESFPAMNMNRIKVENVFDVERNFVKIVSKKITAKSF